MAHPVFDARRVIPSSASYRHQGYESTQPPEPLLNALLHNDCTGKVPVLSVMFAEAPWPEEIHAHLSPFSAPPESSQPVLGNWSCQSSLEMSPYLPH